MPCMLPLRVCDGAALTREMCARRDSVGDAARQEVSKWDWRAATMHLLNVQYPLAMAAAAAAAALGKAAAAAWSQQTTGADGGMKPLVA